MKTNNKNITNDTHTPKHTPTCFFVTVNLAPPHFYIHPQLKRDIDKKISIYKQNMVGLVG